MPIGGGGLSITSLIVIGGICLLLGINPLELLSGGGGMPRMPDIPRSSPQSGSPFELPSGQQPRVARDDVVVRSHEDRVRPAPFAHRGGDAGYLRAAVRAWVVRPRNQALNMILLSHKFDVIAYAQGPGKMLGGSALRSVAHHQHLHIGMLPHFHKNADAVQHPFHRPEIRKMNQQLLARAGQVRPRDGRKAAVD